MGVHGLTTLLRSSGLLPPEDDGGRCCAGSLWPGTASPSPPSPPSSSVAEAAGRSNDDASTMAATSMTNTEVISAGSTLCIDGNGLAFHLLKVAYGRRYGEVLAGGCGGAGAGTGGGDSSGGGRRRGSACLCSSSVGSKGGNSNTHNKGGGSKSSGSGSNNNSSKKRSPAPTPAQIPSLLPTLLPLPHLSTVTSQFVSSLLHHRNGGVRLRIYFDGPSRRCKAHTDTQRVGRRVEEWDNLRRYCTVGALPSRDHGGGGRRSSSTGRKLKRGGGSSSSGPSSSSFMSQERTSASYLNDFPISRLTLDEVRHTLQAYAEQYPHLVEIIWCTEEADVEIAKASADDVTGRTYCVGSDSDFVVFGYDNEGEDEDEDDDDDDDDDDGADTDDEFGGQQQQVAVATVCDDPPPQELDPLDALLHGYYYRYEGSHAHAPRSEKKKKSRPRRGLVLYVPLETLDASSGRQHLTATVLRRPDVAEALGLPDEAALVELSILLGNDYTSEYVRDKKTGRLRGGRRMTADAGTVSIVDGTDDLDWDDVRAVVAHLAEMGPGHRLESRCSVGLADAMRFTRAMFGFRDVGDFPLDGGPNSPTERREEKENAEEKDVFDFGMPQLPTGFRLGLAEMMPQDGSVAEAVLRPLEAYLEEEGETTTGNEEEWAVNFSVPRIRREHIDAFQVVCMDIRSGDGRESNRAPTSPPDWNDVLVAQVIGRCITVAFRSGMASSHPVARSTSPRQVFDEASFHAVMEGLMYDDDPLTNHAVAKNEKAFLEEMTRAIPPAASATTGSEQQQQPPTRQVLPIDEHEDDILNAVNNQRVTIIHGETGCGKSSRVPVMLLKAPPPEPTARASSVKMFISQPRRIAAKSLAERVRSCEPELADAIALRMGHGVREYETPSTRAWFVTTGYLVRLLANHPEKFESHTHLIIDEVHERSVDTDILCLLCRRLLASHPTIRLILMSATMAADLYTKYFDTPMPPIHVGARRFPIKEYFVEDLPQLLHLSHKDAKAAMAVHRECEAKRCLSVPSNSHIEKLHRLAVQVAMSVGRNGSSVLIFVPGMADIVSITELIDNLCVPGVMYTCYPIHGDIPFEEQMAAFEPPGAFEVKVVIATNAAESSITLPDVDHVVCLGLCKQILYNSSSHRQMLAPCWISRASATQRAGRTGRVREGNVYRLYSRNTLHEYMEPYDSGEMVRTPLDSVILSLRDMLHEAVTPLLLECLEPPDIANIDRSFQSLHESNFISSPNDNCAITSLGSLVVSLGIDLTLGALVGLGIQFGVAAEAIQMAAILSFPKTPWSITNPLFHEVDQYNDITAKTFVSRCHFDANLYSEPLAIMNLVWDYNRATKKEGFCRHFSVSSQRLRRLVATIDSLQGRVAERKSIHKEVLRLKEPPREMPHAKVTILRVLQVWLLSDSIIECRPQSKFLSFDDSAPVLSLCGPQIEEELLETVLDRKRHPFTMESLSRTEHRGHFTPIDENAGSPINDFEGHFISYALENGYKIMWYCYKHDLRLFVSFDIIEDESTGVEEVIESLFGDCLGDCVYYERASGSNRRGRMGRAAGLWTETNAEGKNVGGEGMATLVMYSYRLKPKQMRQYHKRLNKAILAFEAVSKFISCFFEEAPSKKRLSRTNFTITVGGLTSEVPLEDLGDLFSTPDVLVNTKTNCLPQTIRFGSKPNAPMDPFAYNDAGEVCDHSSWHRPLLTDVPEGARLLAVLASGRRKDHILRFSIHTDDDQENEDHCEYVDVALTGKDSKVGIRWQRLGTGSTAFVPENSVPAVAVSTEGDKELFACCANTLELKSGGVRAEGLTLLPPGRLFLLLSFLSFGITPFMSWHEDEEKKEDSEDEELEPAQDMLDWLSDGDTNLSIPRSVEERIVEALKFNRDCRGLGEELACFPDKVEALCRVFTGIDGFASEPWDGLHQDAFILGQSASNGASRKSRTHGGGDAMAFRSAAAQINAGARLKKQNGEQTEMKQDIGKEAYGCLECGAKFTKWMRCRGHMLHCCPSRCKIENSKLVRICLIGSPGCQVPSNDSCEEK